MIQVSFTPSFIRQFKKLAPALQQEVEGVIHLFQENPRNPSLKLHKLQGALKGFFGFSINYKYRIVCQQDRENEWALLAVGDHDVYR